MRIIFYQNRGDRANNLIRKSAMEKSSAGNVARRVTRSRVYIGRKEKELSRVDEAPFFFAPPVIITGALSLLPRRGPQWSISFVRRPVAWPTCKVGGYLKAIASLTQRASKGSARVKEEEKDERSKTENKGNGQPPSRCTGGWLASRNCFSTWICKARVNNARVFHHSRQE